MTSLPDSETDLDPVDRPYEPTDDELHAVAREAFAGVAEANRRVRREMDERIAARRTAVMARLTTRQRG